MYIYIYTYLNKYFGGDVANKAFNVQLSGARLLTGRVGAFQTARRFAQCRSFTQCRVFYVIKVFRQI